MQSVRPVPVLPPSGTDLADFIPEGWMLRDSAMLDFNEDGVTDYVGVLEYESNIMGEEFYLSPRILFAVYGDKNGGYCLSFQDANLIRDRSEGGVFGDPYMPLTAEGSSFTTHTYGGSAWRWSEDYTYTYEGGEWYLTSSEESYGYGDYETSYAENDYLEGKGIRRERSSSFEDMEYNWDHMEETQEGQIPYDLVYEVPLDPPITLDQAGMRWWLAPDRRTDWPVERIEIAEGIDLEQEEVTLPDSSIRYEDNDENQALYTFQCNGKYYLALYCFAEKKVNVLAEESGIELAELYQGKIYYAVCLRAPVSYRAVRDGKKEVVQEEEDIGVRLYRIDQDGLDKQTVFEYLLPIEEQEILDACPPYLSLIVELTGNQIIAEVYIGDRQHPFYRMDTDGENQELLGMVPAKPLANDTTY